MGIYAMTLSGAIPAGNLLAGLGADRWGEPLLLAMLGLTCISTAVLLYCAYRFIQRHAPVGPAPVRSS